MGKLSDFLIFDGHNDLLSCLRRENSADGATFFTGRDGAIDLAKCRAGGFGGGFFAVWPRNDPAQSPDPMAIYRAFPAIDSAGAVADTLGQIAVLQRMVATRPDAIRLCRSAADITAARADAAIAALLHIEGCEGIDADLVAKLGDNGINDRDGLGELAVDELVEMTGVSEERARDIIMKARAHWFN